MTVKERELKLEELQKEIVKIRDEAADKFKKLASDNVELLLEEDFNLRSLIKHYAPPTSTLETEITTILHKIGIPVNISGYHFIREAVVATIEDFDFIHHSSKSLYVEVAKSCDSNPDSVERAIRYAIEVAWDRGDFETLESIFGYTVSPSKGRPTNTAFIATLADNIRQNLKL